MKQWSRTRNTSLTDKMRFLHVIKVNIDVDYINFCNFFHDLQYNFFIVSRIINTKYILLQLRYIIPVITIKMELSIIIILLL